jgi:DNA-binding transcriptional ArsR family regulator
VPARSLSGTAGTRARVAELVAARPDLPAGEVAAVLGVSARTARRHLASIRTTTHPPAGNAGPAAQLATGDSAPVVQLVDDSQGNEDHQDMSDRARERTPA